MVCYKVTYFKRIIWQFTFVTTYQVHLWQNNISLHSELQEVYQVQRLELGQHQILDAIESAGSEELLMVDPGSVENPAKIKTSGLLM
jgi:hypothetical protein